jgi:iron complex outermembrane receptor protein
MKTPLSLAVSAATMMLASTNPVVAQEESAGGLEEIIVTAQRRQESLQDAAIAIDAITQDSITEAGIESGLDLGQISPSLGIASNGGPSASLFVRGVGTNTTNPLFDAGVAQNYDGVYLGRPNSVTGIGLYDLERIELLKGPQGTLYGRNATGGVVNYIPNKPKIGESSGFAQLDIGNYEKRGLQGAVNIDVSDTVAIRLAGNYLERDGFADDGTNDADAYGLRAQVLFEPSDELSLRFAADHSDLGGKGTHGDLIGLYSTLPGSDPTEFTPTGIPIDSGAASDAANAVRTSVLAPPAFSFYEPIDPDELYNDTTYSGILMELNYQTDAGTLTVVPAYREGEEDYTFVGPAFGPAPTTSEIEQTTLEVRFATELDGAFNGVFGAFYFDEEVDFSANFNQDFVAPIQNFKNGGDSWAVFAQGTLDISENFRINAGIRYTEDEKFVSGISHTIILFCGGPPGPAFITPPASFGAGCQTQAAFPATSDPDEFINTLIADGLIAPGSTVNDGFWPVINGVPGALVDVDGPGGIDLTNKVSDEEITYRLNAEWDFGVDSMAYVTYERGYRAGGVDISQVEPTYPPEYIDAYTIGTKNRFLDNTLQVNIEAFYWEYTDQQINYFATIGGGPAFPTSAGESTIQGVDTDIVWAASDATTIGLKAQFLDSTLDKAEFFSDPGTGRFNCPAGAIRADGLQAYDCSGNNLVYSPELSLDLNIDHTIQLATMRLAGYANISYRDDANTNNTFLPDLVAEAHTILNLGVTLSSNDGAWSATLYGTNVTDERYLVSTQISATGVAHGIYNAPDTYGLRLTAEF